MAARIALAKPSLRRPLETLGEVAQPVRVEVGLNRAAEPLHVLSAVDGALDQLQREGIALCDALRYCG
jgi:hypothetical protein